MEPEFEELRLFYLDFKLTTFARSGFFRGCLDLAGYFSLVLCTDDPNVVHECVGFSDLFPFFTGSVFSANFAAAIVC